MCTNSHSGHLILTLDAADSFLLVSSVAGSRFSPDVDIFNLVSVVAGSLVSQDFFIFCLCDSDLGIPFLAFDIFNLVSEM